MSFLAIGFLFGLAAIAVPVLIHLIHRQRYPDRRFTTLRFFDKTVKHNVIQRKLIDRILLALRVLALIALMLGLARPFFQTTGSGGIGERRRSVAIVLDNSPSMGRMRDGKMLFDRAKTAATAVLDTLQSNTGGSSQADADDACDRVELILTAGHTMPLYTADKQALKRELAAHTGQRLALLAEEKSTAAENAEWSRPEFDADPARLLAAIDRAPAGLALALIPLEPSEPRLHYSIAQVRAQLDRARVSALPGDVRAAVAKAVRALHESNDGERRIVVLSDLQKSKWQGEKFDSLNGLSVTLEAIDPPAEAGANLAIENVSPAVREVVLGQSVMCTATIRNYGSRPSETAALSIVVGDRVQAAKIEIPPLAATTSMLVSFPITAMTRERNLLCSAILKSSTDTFDYDNTWYFQLGVRPPVTTLCVNGAAGAALSDRETFFVMNALAPRPASDSATAGQGENLVDVRDCDANDLKNQQLFQYSVIVLCGVTTLEADAREKLHRFVSDGGGLMIFPGAKAVLDDYNAWGFLPAKMLERKTGNFVYVTSLADDALAVAGVKQRIGGGLNALSTNTWIALEPDAQPGTCVLANLSAPLSPALVQGRVGKGTVILSAVGSHVSDSDWPLRPAFVILTRTLVKYLGNPVVALALEPNRIVGEGASALVPPELVTGTPALFRQIQKEKGIGYVSLPWNRTDDKSVATASVILQSAAETGHFLLSVQPGAAEGLIREPGLGARMAPVSVNHCNGESIADSMPAADVAALLSGAKVTTKHLTDAAGESGLALAEDLDTGRELWRTLLCAALLFLLLETVVAARSRSETAN